MSLHPMLFAVCLALVAGMAHGADGMIARKSPDSVAATMDRLENIVKQRDLHIFARVDHSAGAERVGLKLRPTQLLIFGNPKGGTPFMQCAQTVGIDLPLKALVWQDESGQVWVGYNDPAYIARRHKASNCPVVLKLQQVLADVSKAAVAP